MGKDYLLWTPYLGESLVVFLRLPEGSLFGFKKVKITKFYLNKASYFAIDADGKRIELDVDYWNNNFKLSSSNKILENLAKNLLEAKHKVNFVKKLLK